MDLASGRDKQPTQFARAARARPPGSSLIDGEQHPHEPVSRTLSLLRSCTGNDQTEIGPWGCSFFLHYVVELISALRAFCR